MSKLDNIKKQIDFEIKSVTKKIKSGDKKYEDKSKYYDLESTLAAFEQARYIIDNAAGE